MVYPTFIGNKNTPLRLKDLSFMQKEKMEDIFARIRIGDASLAREEYVFYQRVKHIYLERRTKSQQDS